MISINRREFVKMLNVGICSLCVGSLVNSCEYIDERLVPVLSSQNRSYNLDISKYPTLQEIGIALAISIKEITGGIKLIVVRMLEAGTNAFVIMSTICPHAGYFISIPDKPGQNYHCNEHNSEYDYYTGEMRHSPDVEPDYIAHLIKFKSEFNAITNILTIYY